MLDVGVEIAAEVVQLMRQLKHLLAIDCGHREVLHDGLGAAIGAVRVRSALKMRRSAGLDGDGELLPRNSLRPIEAEAHRRGRLRRLLRGEQRCCEEHESQQGWPHGDEFYLLSARLCR